MFPQCSLAPLSATPAESNKLLLFVFPPLSFYSAIAGSGKEFTEKKELCDGTFWNAIRFKKRNSVIGGSGMECAGRKEL